MLHNQKQQNIKQNDQHKKATLKQMTWQKHQVIRKIISLSMINHNVLSADGTAGLKMKSVLGALLTLCYVMAPESIWPTKTTSEIWHMMFFYLESKLFKYVYTGAVTRWIWGHTARLLMINSTAHQCITETSLYLFQLCATVLVTPEDEDTPLTCLTSESFIKWCCRRWSARVLLPHAPPMHLNVQLCDRLSLPLK